MTVTMLEPVALSGSASLLRWSSSLTDPTFRIAKDGVEILQTRQTSLVVPANADSANVYEITDDAAERLTVAVAPKANLEFASVTAADRYRVEQHINAQWQTLAIQGDDATGVNKYKTDGLADAQTHQFRVTPIGPDDNEGTAGTANVAMRRHPDPPKTSHTTRFEVALNTTLVDINEI